MGKSYQQSAILSWGEAMHRASAMLRSMEEHHYTWEHKAGIAAVAQAWIAYARELTAHQRSNSVSPGDQQPH